MARARRRDRRRNRAASIEEEAQREEFVDATPERIAMAESEFVNPAEIDSSEQAIGRVRRFYRISTLDRWHRAKVITQRQWWAGSQYRLLHAQAVKTPRVVASYGERTTGGETDYGLARTAAQARARDTWRNARSSISAQMVGYLDRLIIRDDLPRYSGGRHARALAEVRTALDKLAEHFEGGTKHLDAERPIGQIATIGFARSR